MLSDQAIRASWEAERESMREWLLKKKFNPNAVDKCINNFIESAVFAKLPCQSKAGVLAACGRYIRERENRTVTKRQFVRGW
jgi:hypothetical protein